MRLAVRRYRLGLMELGQATRPCHHRNNAEESDSGMDISHVNPTGQTVGMLRQPPTETDPVVTGETPNQVVAMTPRFGRARNLSIMT